MALCLQGGQGRAGEMLVLEQLSSMKFSRVLCCFTVEKSTEMKFDSSKLVLSNTPRAHPTKVICLERALGIV